MPHKIKVGSPITKVLTDALAIQNLPAILRSEVKTKDLFLSSEDSFEKQAEFLSFQQQMLDLRAMKGSLPKAATGSVTEEDIDEFILPPDLTDPDNPENDSNFIRLIAAAMGMNDMAREHEQWGSLEEEQKYRDHKAILRAKKEIRDKKRKAERAKKKRV